MGKFLVINFCTNCLNFERNGSLKTKFTAMLSSLVHGGWSCWGVWEDCSKTCGDGIQRRWRTCNNPLPANGGRPCPGTRSRSRKCNVTPCPGKSNQHFIFISVNLCLHCFLTSINFIQPYNHKKNKKQDGPKRHSVNHSFSSIGHFCYFCSFFRIYIPRFYRLFVRPSSI